MKIGLLIFLGFLVYVLTQIQFYEKEIYKYYETYNKSQKKVVRIYYGD